MLGGEKEFRAIVNCCGEKGRGRPQEECSDALVLLLCSEKMKTFLEDTAWVGGLAALNAMCFSGTLLPEGDKEVTHQLCHL